MRRIVFELFILLSIASFVVFFQFNQVPKKLSFDEVEFTRLALSLDGKSYTPYSQVATGHSTLYFYILLTSFKIFGTNNFALRFPSALFGVFNAALFYFIARFAFERLEYFKKNFFSFYSIIPLFLSIIFVCLRWYFNFTRFAFEASFLLFLEMLAILFLFLFLYPPLAGLSRQAGSKQLRGVYTRANSFASGVKKQKVIYLIFTAIFSGLAFHSYYPGRIFFLLPILFLLLSIRREKIIYPSLAGLQPIGLQKQLRGVYTRANLFASGVKYIALFIVAFIIVISPLLIYLFSHKDVRVQEQLFLSNKKLSLSEKVAYLGVNIIKVSSMFNLRGDLNGRHNYPGKPIVNPVVGAFFLLGFLVALLHLNKFSNRFFLSYFFISILPTLLTYPVENPNSLRTFTAIVPSVYFVGNGIVYLLQSENRARNLVLLLAVGITLLFFLSALYDIRTYFVYQRQVFRKAFELPGSVGRILNLRLWEKIGER